MLEVPEVMPLPYELHAAVGVEAARCQCQGCRNCSNNSGCFASSCDSCSFASKVTCVVLHVARASPVQEREAEGKQGSGQTAWPSKSEGEAKGSKEIDEPTVHTDT